MAEIIAGDELEFRKARATADMDNPLTAMQIALRFTDPGGVLPSRALGIVKALTQLASSSHGQYSNRCERGKNIAAKLGFSKGTQEAIMAHEERWNGKGHPLHLRGGLIPLSARIIALASGVEIFHSLGGPEEALRTAQKRKGAWYDPEVVAAFEEQARDQSFWHELGSDNICEVVKAMEPHTTLSIADEERLEDVVD
ncbi:MAG: hypothetical protein HYX89_01780, partial [Chloroflexi bacterium]|nr:hypothetical protein [Chloroflexota bacterium]